MFLHVWQSKHFSSSLLFMNTFHIAFPKNPIILLLYWELPIVCTSHKFIALDAVSLTYFSQNTVSFDLTFQVGSRTYTTEAVSFVVIDTCACISTRVASTIIWAYLTVFATVKNIRTVTSIVSFSILTLSSIKTWIRFTFIWNIKYTPLRPYN